MFDQATIDAIDQAIREQNRTPDEDLLTAFFGWLYSAALTEDRLASLETAAADCLRHRHHSAMTHAALRLFLDFAKARDG